LTRAGIEQAHVEVVPLHIDHPPNPAGRSREPAAQVATFKSSMSPFESPITSTIRAPLRTIAKFWMKRPTMLFEGKP
jgi:hypothetical protein